MYLSIDLLHRSHIFVMVPSVGIEFRTKMSGCVCIGEVSSVIATDFYINTLPY